MLEQEPWKGIDGKNVPDGGYKYPVSSLFFQPEVLGYLASQLGGNPAAATNNFRELTETSKALQENLKELFKDHGITIDEIEGKDVARGKEQISALGKIRCDYDRPAGRVKPLLDMITIKIVSEENMAALINVLRAAYPTDDAMPLYNGDWIETVHDGKNTESDPDYRCMKVNILYAHGRMAEIQLMDKLARKKDLNSYEGYHNRKIEKVGPLTTNCTFEDLVAPRGKLVTGHVPPKPPTLPFTDVSETMVGASVKTQGLAIPDRESSGLQK